jgi:hypothetical protein
VSQFLSRALASSDRADYVASSLQFRCEFVPTSRERLHSLRKLLPRRATTRTLILAFPVLALLVAFAGTGAAGAETAPTGKTDTIYIKVEGHNLKFVGPKTVTQGDELKIVSTTNPKQVGPHTFSLVAPGSVPKTKPARQNCFTPKHICMAIAKWHGFDPKTEKISINPAKAGEPGWDTAGNATNKKGDSWFTEKKGSSYEQIVSADTSAGPTVLHFVCAIHPWMHGQVEVLPPGA